MQVDVARGGERRPRGVELLEQGLQVLVDGVVLAHGVHVAEVEVAREPRRFVVRGPERDRRMVLEHRHHLRQLLARRGLEESGLVAARVINVRARQRQVLEEEQACLVGLAVEIARQHVGDHAQRVDPGLLGERDVGRETVGGQLVEPVRGRVAGPAQEHGSPVDAKAPAPRADVPRQLSKSKSVFHARGLEPIVCARHQLRAVDMTLTEAPGLPPFGAGKCQAHRHRVLLAAGEVNLAP